MKMKQAYKIVLVVVMIGFISIGFARDWYISAENGKGKTGSIEKPAKDLGNIISKLEPGDVIHITGGTYLGRGENGHDDINMPVEIYGGYDETFENRDPWGVSKTIFTGVHNSDNFDTSYRLAIDTTDYGTKLKEARGEPTEHTVVVDGIIFDNGPRNFYGGDGAKIIRMGTAGDTPTPESGALVVTTGINSTMVIANNIALNTAPTQGVFSLKPGRAAAVTVSNNAAINNTGIGFHLSKSFSANDPANYPVFTMENNISILNEKHDPIATYGGSGVMLESETYVTMTGNIFAMNDYYGIDNARRAKEVIMNENLIFANAISDYLEFDTKIDLTDIEDWSDLMDEASDNVGDFVEFGFSEEFAATYMARAMIDRNAAEEDVQAVDSWSNDVRSIFGLNLEGTSISIDSDVWLPRMELDDAMNVLGRYMDDSFGVYTP